MGQNLQKHQEMKKIKEEILNLKSSPLYNYRTENNFFPVIGEGNHDAKIIFIGEAPGLNEAKTGKPFCGAAGKFFDELLEAAKIVREEVYVGNIVKDRPPENRDPTPQEIAVYGPFLIRQIDIIQPEIVATLGRFSMTYIMEQFGLKEKLQPISKIHGQVFEASASYGKIKIIPMYHPASALYNPKNRSVMIDDIKILSTF